MCTFPPSILYPFLSSLCPHSLPPPDHVLVPNLDPWFSPLLSHDPDSEIQSRKVQSMHTIQTETSQGHRGVRHVNRATLGLLSAALV